MVKTNQSFPDTYSVPIRIQAKRVNTNHRYRHFNQTHFTIGDEEQFEQHRIKNLCLPFKISSEIEEISVWNRYQVNTSSVQQTFQYIFQKFKKGIFIQIRNGKLANFLPFSNTFYVNEWSSRLTIPSELDGNPEFLPKEQWYSNNGLFRYEAPINETDTGMCHMKHMFEQLCAHHSIPDLDFFVNRRDFPLLKKDLTEPYHHIWDSESHPLVSHCYDTYAPLLSSCTREGFADIPIPTMDDWTRVCFKEGIHFAMTKRSMATRDSFTTPWHKKRELAVFRGSSTGIGYDAETNIRIRLCEQFQHHPYCNVGLTSWNTRYRKISGDPSLKIPKPTIPTSNSLSLEEQSMYKYIIHVEGHVQAYRLSIELAMGSVILLVDSPYKLWYQDRLEPWVHYVPVQSNLSDLDERIQWCLDHDVECQLIAKQAREFYDAYLNKQGCLEYLKNVLCKLSYRCVRKTNVPREIFTQKNIQQHYLKTLPKQKGTYQVKGLVLDEYIQRCAQLRRRTCFQNNNTTIIVYDDTFVQKTSKYPYKFDHEQFVGVFCVNRVLRSVPNFTYTVPHRKSNSSILLEYIPGITLFDYIKSAMFNLNEWVFYMIQTLLAISVAQRMCFFTHHDLCPWNIILSPRSKEEAIDYIVDLEQIYRVYTTCVPVIIDYDKTHVVYDLQSFKHFFGFQPFQDALCLFISSIYNIIRYQKLSTVDQKKLLFLFNQTIQDPVYCPNVKTFEDMVHFLDDAHKYAHISFSNKGNLLKKNPIHLIRLLISQYRPGYSSQSNARVVNTIEQTQFVLYTNSYRWNLPKIHLERNVHPILELYLKQVEELATKNTQELQTLGFEEPDREASRLHRICLPTFQVHTNQWASIPVYPSKYLEFLNILIEVANQGGTYRLLPEERESLIHELQNYLNTMDEIYSYSKVLINFKLSRNIL
jgi:hypothetical protein